MHEQVWLRTQRLTLRRPLPEDADRVLAIHGDPLTYQHSPGGRMVDGKQARALLAAWLDHWDRHGFGYASVQLRDAGTVIGFAGAKHQVISGRPMLNLYYRFEPAAWGRGYATESVRAVIAAMHAQLPGVAVVARVATNNVESMRVAHRAGLVLQEQTDPNDAAPHLLFASTDL